MDTYIWIYILVGFFGLILPWLKSLQQFQLLNIPIVAILLGMLIYLLPINLPDPDPIKHTEIVLKLAEIAVIISLIGAGLKIDRKFSFKSYRIPLLLVFITMIGCIAATTLLGWWFGLVPASALLLGTVFAPTDPVIAGGMQVNIEEDEKEEHPVKFSLTAEAGINDGMAFPFTWLAIALAIYGFNTENWLSNWILKDLLYRIFGGIIIGFALGKAIAWLFFTLPGKLKFKPKRLGFLAVAITFFIYGVTEAAYAYGFIAVFVAAVTIRQDEKKHSFHKEMHDVLEQVEQFMMAVILMLLGGYIVFNWFQALTFPMLAICLIFIFIIRPIFGIIATIGSELPLKERLIVSFMGIKGIGSIFYLAFALHETKFMQEELLWGTVAFLIFISVVVHRVAELFIKKWLEE